MSPASNLSPSRRRPGLPLAPALASAALAAVPLRAQT
jgi:hypothetical protein